MQVKYRRLVFFSLLTLFLVYTVVVAVSRPATEPEKMSEKAYAGKLLYQELNCTACHQFYGLGGYMGPDLTNVISAEGKGEPYARALLKHGSARMPDYNLNDPEIDALIAFLNHVDGTGVSPLKHFNVEADGSISLPE